MSRLFDYFGGGAGEGLAAVCGHQSGVKGCWLRCPYSPGRLKQSDHTIPLPGVSSVFFSVAWERDPPVAVVAG